MQTNFAPERLADPHTAQARQILESCQHYGFCTSGCPTYVLLHDENDGPRGRIDLMKAMLEAGGAPEPETVAHIDKCLSCMSCMTTCAVQVDYLHLVDTAREHIERYHRRPLAERWLRGVLGAVLPRPRLFAAALALGRVAGVAKPLLPPKLRVLVDMIPPRPAPTSEPVQAGTYPAESRRRWRVAVLTGCVQPAIAQHINAATVRLLTRHGCDVVVPAAAGCCGSLNLHLGQADAARRHAQRNIAAWLHEIDGEGLDAIVVNASGCGSTVKDYAQLFLGDETQRAGAARIAAICFDVSEWLVRMELPAPRQPRRLRVAYHDACSLRNVQKVSAQPRSLLRAAGFIVNDVPEAHFCCGSAGTYNLLQPEIARQLGERKAAHIASTSPQITAAGNIGCLTQISHYSALPAVHTVELLDWAHGGPCPPGLQGLELPEQPEETRSPHRVIPILQPGAPASPSAAPAGEPGIW